MGENLFGGEASRWFCFTRIFSRFCRVLVQFRSQPKVFILLKLLKFSRSYWAWDWWGKEETNFGGNNNTVFIFKPTVNIECWKFLVLEIWFENCLLQKKPIKWIVSEFEYQNQKVIKGCKREQLCGKCEFFLRFCEIFRESIWLRKSGANFCSWWVIIGSKSVHSLNVTKNCPVALWCARTVWSWHSWFWPNRANWSHSDPMACSFVWKQQR